jgi:hypothetical protein
MIKVGSSGKLIPYLSRGLRRLQHIREVGRSRETRSSVVQIQPQRFAGGIAADLLSCWIFFSWFSIKLLSMCTTSSRLIDPVTPVRHGTFLNGVSDKPGSTRGALCFKIFLVVTIVLAAITVIIGIIALLAVKGAIPGEVSNPLSVIGEVNSYVMIGGGALLFVLGMLTWCCRLHKEWQQQMKLVSQGERSSDVAKKLF